MSVNMTIEEEKMVRKFCKTYYEAFDSRRSKLIYMFQGMQGDMATYPAFNFNGQNVVGLTEIQGFLHLLGETEHTVSTLAPQRIPVDTNKFIINVTGEVLVNGLEHFFSETMVTVLEEKEKRLRILTTNYRLF